VAQILGLPELMQDVNWAQGLLGGYTAYDHEVSMVLLPLRSANRLTKFLLTRLPSIQQALQGMLCFACSHNLAKIFTGRPDGVLRWFSEFVRRCDTGVYTSMELRPESPFSTLGVSLFPVSGPLITRCVTRGVVVCGACIYMPEHPQGWTYSLTFELEGTPEERGFETCQLSTRQWEIEDSQGRVEQVQGEGVIGFFPILRDGGWDLNGESDPHGQYDNHPRFMKGAFRYQSCSGRKPDMRGRFGGALTFIPGTRKKPTGPAFEARLIPFTLEIPEFVF
jgi:F-box protein 3